MLLMPSSMKFTNYTVYLTLSRLTKAHSLTLIYGDESANALASPLRCLYPSTIKPLGNQKMLMLA